VDETFVANQPGENFVLLHDQMMVMKVEMKIWFNMVQTKSIWMILYYPQRAGNKLEYDKQSKPPGRLKNSSSQQTAQYSNAFNAFDQQQWCSQGLDISPYSPSFWEHCNRKS